MRTIAIVVAAGRGLRASQHGAGPKQYVLLNGSSILTRSLMALLEADGVDAVLAVIHPDDQALYDASVRDLPARFRERVWRPVSGGADRQASVCAGLEAVAARGGAGKVLIHDAARPLAAPRDVEKLIGALERSAGAILAAPVTDTLKRASADGQSIAATVSREGHWRALTPQAFHFDAILAAHRAAASCARQDFTDDASVAEAAGLAVAIVPGDPWNLKITTPGDFAVAERLLAENAEPKAIECWPDVRTGQGFDVHRFTEGTSVWLCGVEVPHTQGLEGHSDADVGLHALTDAILGAIGDGDIGQHFPPSDPQWRGARSDIFLIDAVRRVTEAGGTLTNVDVTLICESPKIL
ncbi:MAG: 2-C-methyl-D-erythritol 4-phosphate cytidylyltransferase, partial [Hyphomicrobiaceae bacterium]|nr:2-C-methyl-D-erythritol 4-phosphate cytidylyltransferase [Hyphomicrobiaceae bacterium]